VDDGPWKRGSSRGLTAKGVRLFAIREGADKLLDVARIVYSDTRRDIHDSAHSNHVLQLIAVAEAMRGEYPTRRAEYPGITSTHCEALGTKAGFRFCVKQRDLEAGLPQGVINVDHQRKQFVSEVFRRSLR
jgi:hypothetical protein